MDIASGFVQALCPGAGIFLTAEYPNAFARFTALWAVRKPAERIADQAVALLLRHRTSGAALDADLAEPILLPPGLAQGASNFTSK